MDINTITYANNAEGVSCATCKHCKPDPVLTEKKSCWTDPEDLEPITRPWAMSCGEWESKE